MMTPDYSVLIGVDWSSQSHAIALQTSSSPRLELEVVGSDPKAVAAWVENLRKRFPNQRIGLCVELSKGAFITQLGAYEFIDIYPLNPVTSARFRQAFKPSGAKDDLPDAVRHLKILRQHREELKLWKAPSPQDLRLQILCEKRRKLVALQVDLRNSLMAALRDYFPQALELAGSDLASPLACAFLQKWPDLLSLQRAKPSTVRKFYYAHGCRHSERIEKRLQTIEQAVAITRDPSLIEPCVLFMKSIVSQLRVLAESISRIDKEIADAFREHPDYTLWSSFPGAGPALAPRLAVAWGCDRERYDSARDMQNFSGTSPVRSASGKRNIVFRRYHRPRFLHQSFWEFAKHSANHCSWARTYVEHQVERGKRRSTAYRSLAFKWQRIMFACWKNSTPYDDTVYQEALKRSGSRHYSDHPERAAA